MNTRNLILFISLLLLSLPASSSNETEVKLPPESLEQWYKPSNKRQAWLHTMFKLRREMQAIDEYAKAGDYSRMEKWLSRLDKHYNTIAEMVPEWQHRIKPQLMLDLKNFTRQKDLIRINKTLNSIRRTCNDCHDDFQTVATTLYRTPNYDDIEIMSSKGRKQSLDDNMNEMSMSVNSLLIALDDNRKAAALRARDHLASQLEFLEESCNSCHKDDPYPRERILGNTTQQQLLSLKKHIQQDRIKDSQKLMGQIAVNVCSRCHNIHRTLYEVRKVILSEH